MFDIKKAKVLGSHKGIQLVSKEDGTEFYYSTKTGKTGIGINGLSRIVDCNAITVSNAIKALEKNSKDKVTLELEMYTQKGLRIVKLILEDNLNLVFEQILTSRTKQQTKDNVRSVQAKYVQAGFRLMVLLEVAPEVVAKEAIARIEDPAKAQEVVQFAQTQADYLDSFWDLGDAIKATNAHFGAIHGHNNKLAEIENGKRPQASKAQKELLTVIQIVEKNKLEANQNLYKNGFHATNSAKKAGTQIVQAMRAIASGEKLTLN